MAKRSATEALGAGKKANHEPPAAIGDHAGPGHAIPDQEDDERDMDYDGAEVADGAEGAESDGGDEDDEDAEPEYDVEQAERDELLPGARLDGDSDQEELDDPSASETEPPVKRVKRAEGVVPRIAQKKKMQSSSKKAQSSSKKIPIRLDPSAYEHMDLGSEGLPESWLNRDKSLDAQVYQRAQKDLEECFQKRIDQASKYSRGQSKGSPFCKRILSQLHDKAWTAERYAKVFLDGMCDYRRYLMGLGRVPTAQEIRDIPSATSEQLAMWAVYTDVSTLDGKEYQYTGSGTSINGLGERWRQYELFVKGVRSGRTTVPAPRESHTSTILQPGTKSSLRLRACWDLKRISPTLVCMMEAALLDFENTMNDALPEDTPESERNTGSWKTWAQSQSKEFLDASREAFPSGRTKATDIIGINRVSPYIQCPRVGQTAHRVRVWKKLDLVCPCCQRPKQNINALELRTKTRLATEACFPHPDVPILCHACCIAWSKETDKTEEKARSFVSAKRDRAQGGARREQFATGTRGECMGCFAVENLKPGPLKDPHPDSDEGFCRMCHRHRKNPAYKDFDDEMWLAQRRWSTNKIPLPDWLMFSQKEGAKAGGLKKKVCRVPDYGWEY